MEQAAARLNNCSKNPYAFIEAEVIKIAAETSNIKTFTLKPRGRIGFRQNPLTESRVGFHPQDEAREGCSRHVVPPLSMGLPEK